MNDKISKLDKHCFDKYIKLLGNRYFAMVFTIIMLIVGTWISIKNDNWMWFSRFGSLITISGLFLTMSPIFIRGIYLSQSQSFKFAGNDEDGDITTTIPEDKKIGTNAFIGIIISIIGTVIWGFGDLLGQII